MYAQQVVGADELLIEDACGLPVPVQIDRLERELSARLGRGFAVYEVELQQLIGAPRDVAFDAVVAGKPSPFVIVGDRLICAGAIDVDAVLEAMGYAPAGALA